MTVNKVEQYRKKPVTIKAILWDGTNIDEALQFMSPIEDLPNNDGYIKPGVGHTPSSGELYIPTLEGTMTAQAGDYIIKGIQGEFYPCKPDIFAKTYEPVKAQSKSNKGDK